MLINANALSIPLAAKSVHTVVTSPPYYGLRDYGTAKWKGGDSECEHIEPRGTTLGKKSETFHGSNTQEAHEIQYKRVCQKCGAIRIDEQIGLEVTPDEYIANLVAVFRECKRILRDDGTLWVNIGDSYATNGTYIGDYKIKHPEHKDFHTKNSERYADKRKGVRGNGIKAKDLIGIPWMLAFALRADGWYLRQDIIWAKPNPMPESVKDRCTKSHEYIFLLSKSQKYYYDSEAVKEESIEPIRAREKNNGESAVDTKMRGYDGNCGNTGTRNKRDVWTVTTKPYKGAHYATFNPELIKPCILAGAPETCCAKCGAPYERVVERNRKARNELAKDDPRYRPNTYHGSYENINGKGDAGYTFTQTLGFEPTCDCNAGTSSGIVFDPFVGSGTTAATAIQLGRKGIGIDLSFKYLQENAKARVESAELPLLNFIEQ